VGHLICSVLQTAAKGQIVSTNPKGQIIFAQGDAADSAFFASKLARSKLPSYAFGRVHRTLHLLDHQKTVEFKEDLEHLCEDLSGMLLSGRSCNAIEVECAKVEIPIAFAEPLALIVSAVTTNSAKYSEGSITVRFETKSPSSHSLSVLDHGPGLPKGFDPSRSKGLGMKIVLSLAKQIGGRVCQSNEMSPTGSRPDIVECCRKARSAAVTLC
jgi:two-component sensor histidine kinase